MKKVLKNYLPQIIGIILLTAITIVLYFTFFKNNDSLDSVYISDENITDTAYVEQTNSTSTSTYIRTIPKQSQSSDTYLYYQDILGQGNICLDNIHQTTVGNYIVCESDCSNGDIQSDNHCVGLALCDDLANISTTYTIPSQNSNYYVCSQITALGIVIITTNALKELYYVNIISYELDSVVTLLINYANNALIYPTSSSFLIIAEYEEENIIYSYNDSKLSFSGIMAGSVIDLYEYGTYYALFSNTSTGYSISKISKTNLSTISETFINGFSLISINPIIEDDTQKFILLETNGTIYARKLTNFDNSDSETIKLGSFTISDVCNGDNQLVMVCSGRLNGLVMLNYDLTCQYSESDCNYWITSILDHNYINNIYYYLTLNSSSELTLISQNDNVTNTVKLADDCQKAFFIFQSNNTIMIAYQITDGSYNNIEIIGVI
jgi:hypothetical protein